MDQVNKNKKEMLRLKQWVVVGATPNEHKFGYKIYKALKKHQYQVWGINPKYHELEGDIISRDLKSLPEVPDCIGVVVPPAASLKLVEEAAEIGITYIWFQPGTYDEKVLEKASEKGLQAVYNDCVLVTLGE